MLFARLTLYIRMYGCGMRLRVRARRLTRTHANLAWKGPNEHPEFFEGGISRSVTTIDVYRLHDLLAVTLQFLLLRFKSKFFETL